MQPATLLPNLLAAAWLLPLLSFVIILFFGKNMGQHGEGGARVAVGAIVMSFILSLIAMVMVWLPNHALPAAAHHDAEHHGQDHQDEGRQDADHTDDHAAQALRTSANFATYAMQADAEANAEAVEHADKSIPGPYTGRFFFYPGPIAQFGGLTLELSYYIDALTVTMFCMVTLIASCVHFYALGYMHDELHEPYVDHEVTLSNGEHLHRKGRYWRFFQYLSLFCFSMLGIVIAGNIAMVFVFWELVGICSYFLIGFYIERHSASTAANKAFIVNRVGDFGMLIGMMALWASLGTFAFGDAKNENGEVVERGIFSQLRTEENDYQLQPTEGMIAEGRRIAPASDASEATVIDADEEDKRAGQWLLLIAGVGIFCGCVGKSAQFPLHVWLPDAMEGPTPVSALVHSATMVAAGVYLVGRFYPAFSPETLLVIAYVGGITLLIAATIAITATDIKRVLAYSTVSQLGYMMLALGIGGWVAGMFHLITHAFFKGLLFLCSGSVIHAVHTNDMTEMGGLRKKMPITAYTMLIGCLAIIGAGIPLTDIGFSGYYSKDAIIEQAWSFADRNPAHMVLLIAPVLGAVITAFYMFRLWYMTFAGEPRNKHRYEHAHESPPIMTRPLIVLAVFGVISGWPIFRLADGLLEQARFEGTLATTQGQLLTSLTVPSEHLSHASEFKIPAGIAAFTAAAVGVLLATLIYLWRLLDVNEIRQASPFRQLNGFLWNKWYFDELYWAVFVKPTLLISGMIAKFDRGVIDELLHGAAALCRGVAQVFGKLLDGVLVDGTVNGLANRTWDLGLLLRRVQTGNLRQYVLFIALGTWLICLAAIVVVITAKA